MTEQAYGIGDQSSDPRRENPKPGAYLVAVYLFAGADGPVTTTVAIR